MWQEILAIDSKFNDRRMMEAKDLRPLYLKRRLQLLQGQTNSQSRKVNKPEIECSDPDQYVMRNKKYISLRVKLLKKQFGLPSDLTSLRSLSLSPKANTNHEPTNEYNGVHHVFELEGPIASGTRIVFMHGDADNVLFGDEAGHVQICELKRPFSKKKLKLGPNPVTDFDLNESNELLVAAGQDGALVVWNVQSGQELRRLQTLEGGGFVTACRFLPRNNNLIICALSSGVLQVWNISTGKFNIDCGAKMLGKTMAVTMNPTGNLLWAANDRGYIESFRIDGTTGKLQKGCRVQANSFGKPVTSLTSRPCIGKITRDPCLLATFEDSDQLGLYRIIDDFGTIVPFKSFNSGTGANLKSAIMAPILSYRPGTLAVAGANDGSLLFFDLERESRPCINKLLGHSDSVVALGFSHDETLLASSDQKNQMIIWRKS